MPKPGKRQLSDKMQERNPLDMRQQIIPVDILTTEGVQRTDRPNNDTERLTERLEGTEETRGEGDSSRRIKKANPDTEQTSESMIDTVSLNNDTERLKGTEETRGEGDSSRRIKKANPDIEQTSERMIDTVSLNNDTERLEGTEETRSENDSSRQIKKANPDTEKTNEYIDVSEESNQDWERKQRTPKAKTKTEQTSERSRNIKKLNARTDVTKKTVLQELRQGVEETTTPRAERYSFEIYPDQKDRIKELQNLYQQKTGRKLSASRILREGLDIYLEKAFQLLNEK